MQETELIARAKNGDNDAFGELVILYEKNVYNLALRLCRNEEDALDLSQDIFIRVYKALPFFKAESKFSTWLYSIASNACIDFTRREAKRKTQSIDDESFADLPDLSNLPEDRAIQNELSGYISDALSSLSPEHREVIVLRELDGLSYSEIADALDIEVGTVKSRICRARERMCAYLGNKIGARSSNHRKGR